MEWLLREHPGGSIGRKRRSMDRAVAVISTGSRVLASRVASATEDLGDNDPDETADCAKSVVLTPFPCFAILHCGVTRQGCLWTSTRPKPNRLDFVSASGELLERRSPRRFHTARGCVRTG